MVRQQAAKIDVLHHAMEELQNNLAGFKTVMAGIHRKYDTNFQEIGVSVRRCHSRWISHEVAIEKINERCTCGADDSGDEYETVETVSSPLPVGTPVLPDPVPLQVMPSFSVRQVIWVRFVHPTDLSFLDASSSGRSSLALES